MIKLLLLIAAIAAVKSEIKDNIYKSWLMIGLPSVQNTTVTRQCYFGSDITKKGDYICTCGTKRALLVEAQVRNRKDISPSDFLAIEVDTKEDIQTARSSTCNCPEGVSDKTDKLFVKQISSDYMIGVIFTRKLEYAILGTSPPTQSLLHKLEESVHSISEVPIPGWKVCCAKAED